MPIEDDAEHAAGNAGDAPRFGGFRISAPAGITRTWRLDGAARVSGAAEQAIEPNTLYEAS